MKTTALVILHPGFEEMEAVAPIDLLARANIEVTQASLTAERLVKGKSGMTLLADCSLGDLLENQLFDTVILPGGPGINEIRNHTDICKIFQRHHTAGKLVACICAAPLLLLDAGIAEDLRYTAHPAARKELPNAENTAFILDGNILTSAGAGTATEFGLALIETLKDRETRDRIADSICWRHD